MKKIIALVLSVLLLASLLPIAALASTPTMPGVYTELNDGVLGGYTEVVFDGFAFFPVSYTSGEGRTVYYWRPDVTSVTFMEGPNGASIAPKTDTDYEGLYEIIFPAGLSGTHQIVFETSTGGGECIVFSDGTGDSGSQGGGQGGTPAPVIPQHQTQPEEKLSDPSVLNYDPAPFTFGGDTYYLYPMALIDNESMTFRMGGSTSNPPLPVTAPWTYCVGFWTFTEGVGYQLADKDTRNQIMAAFGDSLTMTMYAMANENSTHYPDYAKCYPETNPNNPDGWPCGATYVFTEMCAGSWVFAAEGTIDGKQVSSAATFRFEPRKEVNLQSCSTVEEINAALMETVENYPAPSEVTVNLTLPAGDLWGIITVPENLFLVNIYGANTGTTLHGGMYVHSRTIIEGIDFEGAGRKEAPDLSRSWDGDWHNKWNGGLNELWHHTWPAGTVNAESPNYAVWGTVNILYNECTFRGYWHAFHNTRTINFGGDNSEFVDNAVAIYFNTADGEPGNLTMTNVTFRKNGCALWLEQTNPNYLPAEYQVIRCKFIDNGIDTANRTKRLFFLNGNFFSHSSTVGPVFGLSESAQGGVHSFPYANEQSCETFNYSEDNAVVLNSKADSWRIPSEDLDGKTVTVVDAADDSLVGTWVFE